MPSAPATATSPYRRIGRRHLNREIRNLRGDRADRHEKGGGQTEYERMNEMALHASRHTGASPAVPAARV
jgi:hypothetical protein